MEYSLQSSCLCLLRAGIAGLHHHAWLGMMHRLIVILLSVLLGIVGGRTVKFLKKCVFMAKLRNGPAVWGFQITLKHVASLLHRPSGKLSALN
jgi:uncharacterized protein YneF (UPF0154 family)